MPNIRILLLAAVLPTGCGPDNLSPEPLGTIPPMDSLFRGEPDSINARAYFTDSDGDSLTFDAESSDAAIVTASTQGDMVIVTAVATGMVTVTVTASDPEGEEAEQEFSVTVLNRAPEPLGTIPPMDSLFRGEPDSINARAYFTDSDGDSLTFDAESSDAVIVTASTQGDMVIVTAVATGMVTVTVTASDPEGGEAEQEFSVTVPNRAPAITDTISGQEVSIGQELTIDLEDYFEDLDGDLLTYDAASSDDSIAPVSVSGSEVTIEGRALGVATAIVTASDGEEEGETEQVFDIVVFGTGGGFEDHFDSLASAWEIDGFDTAYVSDRRLLMRNPEGDILSSHAYRDLPDSISGDWTAKVSMGMNDNDTYLSLLLGVAASDVDGWILEIDTNIYEYYVWYVDGSDAEKLFGGDIGREYEEGLIDIVLTLEGNTLSARYDGFRMFSEDMTNWMEEDPPEGAVGISLGAVDWEGDAGTLQYDFVAISPEG